MDLVRYLVYYVQRAPIDPFNREGKPLASQGVPLGGMGSGSITRGFRGEFRQFQILPSTCEASPVMANQFSKMHRWSWSIIMGLEFEWPAFHISRVIPTCMNRL